MLGSFDFGCDAFSEKVEVGSVGLARYKNISFGLIVKFFSERVARFRWLFRDYIGILTAVSLKKKFSLRLTY